MFRLTFILGLWKLIFYDVDMHQKYWSLQSNDAVNDIQEFQKQQPESKEAPRDNLFIQLTAYAADAYYITLYHFNK